MRVQASRRLEESQGLLDLPLLALDQALDIDRVLAETVGLAQLLLNDLQRLREPLALVVLRDEPKE